MVTGASGQLGIEFVKKASLLGFEVYSPSSVDLDITDFNHIESFILEREPHVVVNCAAWTDVESANLNATQANLINNLSVKNLAVVSRKLDCKFLTISTDYVFDGNSQNPWKVSDQGNPKSIYGKTKYDGEKAARLIYPEGTHIIRTAWLYSPWRTNFVKSIIRLGLQSQEPINVVNDQFGQPTLARDLAGHLIEFLVKDCGPGIYHATNSGVSSWFQFAQKIFKEIGLNSDRIHPISTELYHSKVDRPKYSVLDNFNVSESFVEPMRPWSEALSESIDEILFEVKRGI